MQAALSIIPRTSDLATSLANVGKLWMRTDQTSATVKCVTQLAVAAATWATAGGSLSVARMIFHMGFGSQASSVAPGGTVAAGPDASEDTVELWADGVFSSSGDLPEVRAYAAGMGTSSAGLLAGGNVGAGVTVTDSCLEWDGSTWSSGGTLAATCSQPGGCGTQTAGLKVGGYTGTTTTNCQEYDGASWASGGSLSTASYSSGCCGTQTAGLATCGAPWGSSIQRTEEYDGASWGAGGNYGSAHEDCQCAGTQTDGLGFSGYNGGSMNLTKTYDGAAWSASNNLVTGRKCAGGSTASSATALVYGGNSSGYLSSAEVRQGVNYLVKTVGLS